MPAKSDDPVPATSHDPVAILDFHPKPTGSEEEADLPD